MSTVVGRMFKVMLDTARQAGVDVASIERSYFPDGIEPGRDFAWDTYVAMTDEICDRIGDPDFRVTRPPREPSTLTRATLGHDHIARGVGLLRTLAAERGKRHQRDEALRADVAALGLAKNAPESAGAK